MERDGLGAQRFFFALWPDDKVRDGLGAAARRMHRALHGRRTRDENLHLTLAFLGEVDIEDLERLRAPPPSLAAGAFTLTLDRWDCWPRNRIGWAGPSVTPPALQRLAANLVDWLQALGFELEKRRFAPHVTLVRDAQHAAMPGVPQPVRWHVEDFVLVRSQRLPRGSQYEIVARWPLDGGVKAVTA
ncbi:MAG TPA: RNA 2',3'-cyclic phosphodiesterase [Burkholderiales bacterium]|jgi:2'-5' RNA ligase|nr:RNA 2',3'-cyclic phosphodiesterase [Burkholderiales bacterium]